MLFAVTLSPESVECPIPIGQLIDDTLREIGMTHKEAWVTAGYRDGATWSRAIHDEPGYTLCLRKLARLPWRFQAPFWSKYIAAQATRLSDDLRADRLVMAKADLVETTKRRQA